MAAGGGLPQWNCGCTICHAARAGEIPARTQSSVALSADGARWFLVNASPDLRAQLAGFEALQPRAMRDCLVEAVLLTNADLDHVLGLFLLREGGGLAVHATPAVRETLIDGLRLESVLGPFGGITWTTVSEEKTLLLDRAGLPSGLSYRAIPLPGGPPPYAGRREELADGHSIAFEFTDDVTGGRLLIAPDLAEITLTLRTAVEQADAVLLDSTFWSDDELRQIRPGARTAREMGHLPISGSGGTLKLMQTSSARLKACMHINNTNPIFLPGSPERAAMEQAGVIVPEDGWEFAL